MKARVSILIISMLFFLPFSLWAQVGNQDIRIPLGSTLTLTASSTNGVSYQWYHNNSIIPNAITSQYLATSEGVYTVVSFSAEDCLSEVSEGINVIFETVSPPILGKNIVCASEETAYTTNTGMKDYIWKVQGGQITDGGSQNDSFVKVIWGSKGEGLIDVSYTDEEKYYNPVGTMGITISNCSNLILNINVSNNKPLIDDVITFTVTIINEGTNSSTGISINKILPSGYSYVTSTVSHGSYNAMGGIWSIPVLESKETATFTIEAKVLKEGEYFNKTFLESSNEDPSPEKNEAQVEVYPDCLFVYNGFSPNGDGHNDFFKINCIEKYPNNSLELYSKSSGLVYSTKNYKNDWNGTTTFKNCIKKGGLLAAGIYYYVLDLGDGSKAKVGWVFIR